MSKGNNGQRYDESFKKILEAPYEKTSYNCLYWWGIKTMGT